MPPAAGARDTSFEGSYGQDPGSTTDEKQALAEEFGHQRKGKSDFQNYMYNSKTGEVCGRTFGSWCKLIVFVLFFVSFLVILWGLCLWTFYQTLDNYEPKLQTSSSFIGMNPGLGFRPMRQETDPYSSLIWFTHGGAGNWDDLKLGIDKFLAEYEPGYFANAGASQTKCGWNTPPLNRDEACEFNKEWLSDARSDIKCISEEHYGYYHGKPCVLLKLNRVYGWAPTPYYNITEVDNHPTMPDQLKKTIRDTWKENCMGDVEKEDRCPELNMVWLHCDGENSPDKENVGLVSYTPWQGFPGYYFPYWNQLGYLQPIVMVQLKNPTPGVLMNIECTAWAKGLEHDRKLRRGSVHFEFLMD